MGDTIKVNTDLLRQYSNDIKRLNKRLENLDFRMDTLALKLDLNARNQMFKADRYISKSGNLSRISHDFLEIAHNFENIERNIVKYIENPRAFEKKSLQNIIGNYINNFGKDLGQLTMFLCQLIPQYANDIKQILDNTFGTLDFIDDTLNYSKIIEALSSLSLDNKSIDRLKDFMEITKGYEMIGYIINSDFEGIGDWMINEGKGLTKEIVNKYLGKGKNLVAEFAVEGSINYFENIYSGGKKYLADGYQLGDGYKYIYHCSGWTLVETTMDVAFNFYGPIKTVASWIGLEKYTYDNLDEFYEDFEDLSGLMFNSVKKSVSGFIDNIF